jgi:hypothetical protein
VASTGRANALREAGGCKKRLRGFTRSHGGSLIYVHVRSTLIVATLVTVAGCSGAATAPPGSVGTPTGGSVVHRTLRPTYSTKKSLVFVSGQIDAVVNIC